ncbi:hypothetical protein ABL78_2269 [Leptomonas seymouri]|uniref:Thioesterase-like protein n=1 Tax=Leptomonas seymouri TaxID=5684 RepID=A0A0N1I9E3_LEPSE|nr:hypothetical protein ABL78_2269 [Leptomonas seymouri]|eukprot:KPI88601.1 hypothetical protein ABL78_2269 [Leptomonas seymouri]
MVLLHFLRSQRYFWRGLRDGAHVREMIYGVAPLPADSPTAVVPSQAVRNVAAMIAAESKAAAASGAKRKPPSDGYARGMMWPWRRRAPCDPGFAQFIAQPLTISVYCGMRMIDELGHVNNAKYLEIAEFGRWHQLAFLGLGSGIVSRGISFVVSDLSITYQREIGPCRKVWVRTRFVLPPQAPAVEGDAAATAEVNPPGVAGDKRLFIEQELWSADGQRLHAALTLAVAFLGPVEYEKELHERYGMGEAARAAVDANAKQTRPRTALNCVQVMADVAGFSSTAELRQAFASVERVCTPVADANGAASRTADAGVQANGSDTEGSNRVRTLARVWEAARKELRRKSLIAKP